VDVAVGTGEGVSDGLAVGGMRVAVLAGGEVGVAGPGTGVVAAAHDARKTERSVIRIGKRLIVGSSSVALVRWKRNDEGRAFGPPWRPNGCELSGAASQPHRS
jgi:hypothetical protein